MRGHAKASASASASDCALTTSVTATTLEAAVAEVAEAAALGADIVELRADFVEGLAAGDGALKALLEACAAAGKPAIVTCRPTWEGGQFDGEEEARLAVLCEAFELGAPFVDCELLAAERLASALPSGARDGPTRLILSSHNYEETPGAEELAAIAARMAASGADIAKIATTAVRIEDVAAHAALLARSGGASAAPSLPTVALAMGEAGVTSRLLAPKLGGFLTFGALGRGRASAPGQPTLEELRAMYRLPAMTPGTATLGVVGRPVGHSRSPALHNAALSAANADAVYVPLLVEELAPFLATEPFASFKGFSVTIPHKEAALECADEVDPLAAEIGAVNTLVRGEDGKLRGYNTDCAAAIRAIELGLGADPTSADSLAGLTVVVVGAGGAGRAVAFGAKAKGASVVVANRSIGRAEELAAAVGGGTEALTLADLAAKDGAYGDILANTTSVGMAPDVDATPVPKEALAGYRLVFDAIYTPLETRLLREAKAQGAGTASGLEMFVGQAAEQFTLFTGMEAPEELMRETVLASLEQAR